MSVESETKPAEETTTESPLATSEPAASDSATGDSTDAAPATTEQATIGQATIGQTTPPADPPASEPLEQAAATDEPKPKAEAPAATPEQGSTDAKPPSSENAASETGAPETGAPETGASETGASETGASETGASGSEPTETESTRREIKIGSQREGQSAEDAKPNPVTKVSEGTKSPEDNRKSFPPPNVRDKLSPEMEAELEAAIGGDSMDAILGDGSADASEELAAGTKVQGKVVKVSEEDLFLEVPGTRHQGVVQVKQFKADAEGKRELPEPGSQLEAIVSKFDPEQGLYEMSLATAAVEVGDWDSVSEGQIVDVVVDKANKGGLECKVSGIRGFIPMGQISIYRVENAEDYVGKKLTCVISEVSRKRKNLVLSHRALMERERKEQKEKLLAEIAPGQIREGVVRSLQDFGAFVDLGGADGLVHVSQLSWDRIGHPSEVLQVGEKIKVKVEKVNQETGKIALSYREAGENPWNDVTTKYGIGSKVKGTVTKLMQFGAFVKLQPGVEGLIHISELGHGRVHRTSDVLSEGQEVEVQVLSVDADAQKIGLSLKALMAKPEKPKSEKEQQVEAAMDEADAKTSKSGQRKKKKHDPNLKGGIGGPTGGEQFGLKW